MTRPRARAGRPRGELPFLLALPLKRPSPDAETPRLLFEASEARSFVADDAFVLCLRARLCDVGVGDATRVGCFLADLRPVARYAGVSDVEIVKRVAELVEQAGAGGADGGQLALGRLRHPDAQRAKAAMVGGAGEKRAPRDAHGAKFVPLATAVALLVWLVRRLAAGSRPELLPDHEWALVALVGRVLASVDGWDAEEVARARRQLPQPQPQPAPAPAPAPPPVPPVEPLLELWPSFCSGVLPD